MRRLVLFAIAVLLAAPAVARPLDEEGARVRESGLNWTTIVPGRVALGSGGLDKEHVPYLAEQGFGAVLNLRGEHDDPEDLLAEHGIAYRQVPLGMAEMDTFDDEEIEEVLAFLREQHAQGRAVYVHCTAGWHRAAIAVAVWLMEEEGLTADEAWERLEALRPRVEPRWIDGLYGYEARRDGRPQLEVDLRVPGITAKVGDRMDIVATVTVGGRPFAGAVVRFIAEYDDIEEDVVTDVDGVARLVMTMDESRIQYVSAHARADPAAGVIAGYDRVAIWATSKEREVRRPFTLEVEGPDGPLLPGSVFSVGFRALHEDGKPMNARVSVTDGERTLWRSYLERDGKTDAVLRAPETPGRHVLTVRATSPYAPTIHADLVVEVDAPPDAETDTPPPGGEGDAPPEVPDEAPVGGADAEDAAAPDPVPREDAPRLPLAPAAAKAAPFAAVAAVGVLLWRWRVRA